jgi:hypothetical protein
VAVGKWDDQVRTHAVQTAFATVLAALDGLDAELVEQAPEDVERLFRVVGHVQERLNRAPAMVVPMHTLGQLNQHLDQLNADLSNVASTRQVSYLGNANTQADHLLEQARVLPPLPLEGVTVDAETYLERVSGMVATVVADAEKDRERLHDTADTLDSRLTTVTSQLETLETNAAAQAAKLDQALADQKTQFSADQAERTAAFRDAEDERTQQAEDTARQAKEQFTATAEELTGSAAGTLQSLAELKQQAEDLVAAIGLTGVAAGYNETAQQEGKVADRLRVATIVVALAAAAVLVFALFVDHSAAGSWQQLLTRLLLSASFAGVAAYCGRESAAHRAVARDARERHLQLAALNPYLANLPEEERLRLKSELAPGYFAPGAAGKAADGDGEQADGQLTARLLDLANTLATKGANR